MHNLHRLTRDHLFLAHIPGGGGGGGGGVFREMLWRANEAVGIVSQSMIRFTKTHRLYERTTVDSVIGLTITP